MRSSTPRRPPGRSEANASEANIWEANVVNLPEGAVFRGELFGDPGCGEHFVGSPSHQCSGTYTPLMEADKMYQAAGFGVQSHSVWSRVVGPWKQ